MLKIIEKRTFVDNKYLNEKTKKYDFFILKENMTVPENKSFKNHICKKDIVYIMISIINNFDYLNIIKNIENLKENDYFKKNYIDTILNSELIDEKIKNKIQLYFNL